MRAPPLSRTISRTDNRLSPKGIPVAFTWPANADSIELPAASVFKAETPGRTIQFKVKYLTAMPATAEALNSQLEAMDCREQAGTLAENVNLAAK